MDDADIHRLQSISLCYIFLNAIESPVTGQDDAKPRPKTAPSTTTGNRNNIKPNLDTQLGTCEGSRDLGIERSTVSKEEQRPQTEDAEDSEEIKLKEDLSKILEEKALLKRELKDSQPPDEIEPCLSRAQLFSTQFSSCTDDNSIESWLPLITDELGVASHLLEQWEEELGDTIDMARQFPDQEERTAIRGKMDSLHLAFYDLREGVLCILRERMGQMTKEIPEEAIMKFAKVCVNVPCITARYWADEMDKHHFEQLRLFFDENVLPSECIAEFCVVIFGAMKFNAHMEILRDIYNEIFTWVYREVDKYSGWDRLGTFEVTEPFDWKHHQHQAYFQAILPLDLYRTYARSPTIPTSDAEKTLFEKHGTHVLYRWIQFVKGYKILCHANSEYKHNWPKEPAAIIPPLDFGHTVALYAEAVRGLRETELGGHARMRIGLIMYSLLGDWPNARRAFTSALKDCQAETPGDRYYNTGWAIQCRDYLVRMDKREKEEAERKAKEEKERQEKLQKEKEEKERQAKLAQEKADRERADFYLTHNLDVLGFKTMEVNGAASLLSLLRWVTETFKPPDESQRQKLEELTKRESISRGTFLKIIRLYHPDKNGKENEMWRRAAEEVTKMLNKIQEKKELFE